MMNCCADLSSGLYSTHHVYQEVGLLQLCVEILVLVDDVSEVARQGGQFQVLGCLQQQCNAWFSEMNINMRYRKYD